MTVSTWAALLYSWALISLGAVIGIALMSLFTVDRREDQE